MKRWLAALLLFSTASVGADTIDSNKAKILFAERQALCDADQGKLWGQPLCGPMLFVDDASHQAVANQAGKSGALSALDGVFVGKLPAEIPVANTATDWDGVRWAMVEWPLPEDRKERDALLIHESWHRIQAELGLPARSPIADHLSPALGRIALRLEWRALATALTAPNEASRKTAIRDALVFRRWRRAATRHGGEIENQLELNEGLAEYTGCKLSGQDAAAIAAWLGRAERKNSFVRSFAYASGPAYGYLLDFSRADWRHHLNAHSDLAIMLAVADGISLPKDVTKEAMAAGQRYDYTGVAAEERDAERRHAEQAKYWSDLLVKGPVLRLPLANMQIHFDPGSLFPLPPHGMVYPTLEVIAEWGALKTESGGLVDKNWSTVIVPVSAQSSVTLKPGWSWKAGKRKGDLVAAK